MRDPCDRNVFCAVINEVDDPPVTYPNAPVTGVDFQFLAAGRTRIVGQGENLAVNSLEQGMSNESNSLCADCLSSSEYLSTGASAFQTGRAVLLVGNALFFAPFFRHKTVPKILPDGTVLLEIDQHRDFAALLIGDELDAGHS
jgi:hypothetical protein